MKIKDLLDYPFIFVVTGLIFGIQLVYTNPPWQSNDEDRHFYNAYALSDGTIGPRVKDGKIGQYLPGNLIGNVQSFQGIAFSEQLKIQRSVLTELKIVENDKANKVFNPNVSSTILPFAYLPAALGISVAKLLHKSPVEIGWYARIAALLAYLLIVFYAIKIIPRYKPLLSAIALTPMALYQAGSVSYDSLSFALLFLFFAMLVSYYFSGKPLSVKQIGMLVLVAFLQRLCKDGYTLLYLTVLILPASAFASKKDMGLMLIGLVIAAFVPAMIWNAYLQSLNLPDAANGFQKDFLFNSTMNMQYHASNPAETMLLLIQNTCVQGKEWLIGAVGRFGYSYTRLPETIALGIWGLMVSSSLTELPVAKKRFSIIFICLALANIAMVIVGFLVVGSPVGAHVIFGLQGRYFTPILPFLLAGAFQIKLFHLNPAITKWIVFGASALFLMYTLQYLDGVFYA